MRKRNKNIFFVLRWSMLKLVLGVMLCFVLLSFSFGGNSALASVFVDGKTRLIPIYCVDKVEKEVAITFDAAWGSDRTEKILDILKKEDVPATFFLVGMWVDKNEELTKKIDEMGFEIGTHSNTHPDFTKLSGDNILLEFETSVKKISKVTGKNVELFRCPFGAYNNEVISCCDKLKLKTIQWNVDSLDWKEISSGQIVKNVVKKVVPGSIILCHNNAENIVEALPTIIQTLKSRGYKFLTVGNLILKDNFRIDHTGKQVAVQ